MQKEAEKRSGDIGDSVSAQEIVCDADEMSCGCSNDNFVSEWSE